MSNLIKIGTLRRPHGIKGGLHLSLMHDGPPTVLHPGIELLLSSVDADASSPMTSYTLKEASKGPKVIIYLEGISDRTQAENLLPKDIYIDRSHFPAIEDSSEVYCVDLIGLPVYNYETKEAIGIIKDTYSNGAHEIFVVLLDSQEEIDIPFTDHFVPILDMNSKRVEVRIPEWT